MMRTSTRSGRAVLALFPGYFLGTVFLHLAPVSVGFALGVAVILTSIIAVYGLITGVELALLRRGYDLSGVYTALYALATAGILLTVGAVLSSSVLRLAFTEEVVKHPYFIEAVGLASVLFAAVAYLVFVRPFPRTTKA